VADVDSIFYGKPIDPDFLTVVMKNGKMLYCDEVCPIDSLQEEPELSHSKVTKISDQEKPVSEDLGEYINELSKQFPEVSFAKLSRIAVRVAKWMMKDAVEETVGIDSNGLACVNVNDDDIMIGDTVKVLIKKGGKQ
jgi:hypothetical protein